MEVVESELDVWSLSEVDLDDACLKIRSDRILMMWTWIEASHTYVLNLLAPRGHAFWDMGAFKAFAGGHHRYGQRLVERGTLRTEVRDLLVEVGRKPKSHFAWYLLGGVTRFFGDAFLPEEATDADLLFASRLESFAVPAECRESVSFYFRRQAIIFGERSTIAVPEDRQLVVSDQSRSAFSDWTSLLAIPVPALSREQRKAALLALETTEKATGPILLDRDLHVCFGRPGDISLALPFRVQDAGLMHDFLGLAKFRIDIALRISALPVLEGLRDELLTPGWEDVALADLRGAALEQFCARLQMFPEMLTNPFQLAT
jgi:hypothetical protein